jgi:hypothetical protein
MKAVRFHLIVYYGQLRRGNHRQAKILTPRTSGLAQSFCLPPRNQPCCCFFLSHFLQKGKKDVCTPTATTVLHLRQKKTTQSYIYIMLSYVRFL